ncbi:MAG: hypothetical protein R3E12_00470 [Candidatus Eisenbacteria bacterium]
MSQALSAIRLSLESASSRPVLLAQNHRDVALDPTLIDCDVYAYRGLVGRVGRRLKTDELAQAVDLYRGDSHSRGTMTIG